MPPTQTTRVNDRQLHFPLGVLTSSGLQAAPTKSPSRSAPMTRGSARRGALTTSVAALACCASLVAPVRARNAAARLSGPGLCSRLARAAATGSCGASARRAVCTRARRAETGCIRVRVARPCAMRVCETAPAEKTLRAGVRARAGTAHRAHAAADRPAERHNQLVVAHMERGASLGRRNHAGCPGADARGTSGHRRRRLAGSGAARTR